ncbi:hypothetical protein FGG78_33120, partial [Thioclava sp. BHET1]
MTSHSLGRGFIGLTAALALSVSALAVSRANAADQPQKGGDLVMLRSEQLRTLLPSQPTDNASIWPIEEVFNTLLVP